jgi:hypothetical protein
MTTAEVPGSTPPPPRYVPGRTSPIKRWVIIGVILGSLATLIITLGMINLTFTMHGTFTTFPSIWASGSCTANVAAPGARVTVYNHLGVAVGQGTLDAGTPTPGYRCEYSFTVTNVPYWEPTYSIDVGGFGRTTVSRDNAENPRLCELISGSCDSMY